MKLQPLCPLADIGELQSRGFDPERNGSDTVFVVRHGGILRVYENKCPHLLVPLEYRKNRFLSADGARIICYAHGAQFRPEDGVCVYGPCLGERLRVLEHVEHEGWIWIAGECGDT
ncbi:Rieske 2Fe-2S domain-containing protein [Pseudomonas sp. CC120222-01a]|uniref:Rieske (2Fe-2S) protein n=1 Tax=Pseudomonas sp. CC120222-01a TaxID=1378075 RepID=UPI000DA26741|nr:Rieske 2Fe-2S domain-containing protein [Pseudomonas sp. CC120222-01a]